MQPEGNSLVGNFSAQKASFHRMLTVSLSLCLSFLLSLSPSPFEPLRDIFVLNMPHSIIP